MQDAAPGGVATRAAHARATLAASRIRTARTLAAALADPADFEAATEDRPVGAGQGAATVADGATTPQLIVTSTDAGAVIIKVVAPASA
jgi:hypothetical protein